MLRKLNVVSTHAEVLVVVLVGENNSLPRVEVSPLKIAKRCKICGELEEKCKICVRCDDCGEKKLLSGEIFFQRLSGERKFFTATRRMR